MRSSGPDPAQTTEAKAKRAQSLAARAEAAKRWEAANPGAHERETFVRDILPLLQGVTLPAMMKATGLASGYCLKIKRGERIPHPMYWLAFRAIAADGREPPE